MEERSAEERSDDQNSEVAEKEEDDLNDEDDPDTSSPTIRKSSRNTTRHDYKKMHSTRLNFLNVENPENVDSTRLSRAVTGIVMTQALGNEEEVKAAAPRNDKT